MLFEDLFCVRYWNCGNALRNFLMWHVGKGYNHTPRAAIVIELREIGCFVLRSHHQWQIVKQQRWLLPVHLVPCIPELATWDLMKCTVHQDLLVRVHQTFAFERLCMSTIWLKTPNFTLFERCGRPLQFNQLAWSLFELLWAHNRANQRPLLSFLFILCRASENGCWNGQVFLSPLELVA